MRVTNKGGKTLGMPNGVALATGASTEITTDQAKSAIVAAWIARGFLEVRQSAPAEPQADTGESEADEKDQLIAALADHEVYRDRRTSLENLRALLDEVRAEDAHDLPAVKVV